ncbi:hypothetical protein Tco_0816706 [Tanacetum coccineum]
MEEQDNNASSSLSDFPISPITALPGTLRPAAILIRPVEAITLGRPYLTHPNGTRRAMTMRKRVGPLPTRKLALRRVSPHQAHSGSSTRVVSHRLGYPPRRALRRSEAFCHWCATPLSTLDRVNSLRLYMSLLQEEFRQVRMDHDDTRRRLRRLESYLERTTTNTRSGMTHAAIEEMINQCVDATLETHRINQDLGLENRNDNRGGDGNGNGKGNGNGNGAGNGNNEGDNGVGNENHNVNGRGDRPVARECTYQDFMKCQPLSFKGTKGVVGLIRWSEKIETVFHISNCSERYQVKYAACTLLDIALTWWNSHKRTIRTDATYALSWRELMKLMTEVYCLRNEVQKMETEL